MRNNKQLYNQIIHNVSKVVKRTLNEEVQNFNPVDYQEDDTDIINSESVESLTKENHTKDIKEIEHKFNEIYYFIANKDNYNTSDFAWYADCLANTLADNWEDILNIDDQLLGIAIKNVINEGIVDYYHNKGLFMNAEDAYPILKNGFDKKPEYLCFVYEKPYQQGLGLIYVGTLKFTYKFDQDLADIICDAGYERPTPETYKKINTAADTFIDVFIDFPENDNREVIFIAYGKSTNSKKYNEISRFDLEFDSIRDYENKLADEFLYTDPNCFWDDYYSFIYEEIDNNENEE